MSLHTCTYIIMCVCVCTRIHVHVHTAVGIELVLLCLVHAAVMAINEVLEKEDVAETLRALQNPAACLVDVQSENGPRYQVSLLSAKREKSSKAGAQVLLDDCTKGSACTCTCIH